MSFARSPYDMVAYDDKAEYDVPADGSQLPELLPMENDVPGMSYSNYFHYYIINRMNLMVTLIVLTMGL